MVYKVADYYQYIYLPKPRSKTPNTSSISYKRDSTILKMKHLPILLHPPLPLPLHTLTNPPLHPPQLHRKLRSQLLKPDFDSQILSSPLPAHSNGSSTGRPITPPSPQTVSTPTSSSASRTPRPYTASSSSSSPQAPHSISASQTLQTGKRSEDEGSILPISPN